MLKIDSAELTFAMYCMYVRRRQLLCGHVGVASLCDIINLIY